jgi:hypothetical protein
VVRNREAAPSRYLAEWYTPRLKGRAITDIASSLSRALAAMPQADVLPKLLYAIEIPAEGYAFGVFAADSESAVTQACEQAGLPAERVTAAVEADLRDDIAAD